MRSRTLQKGKRTALRRGSRSGSGINRQSVRAYALYVPLIVCSLAVCSVHITAGSELVSELRSVSRSAHLRGSRFGLAVYDIKRNQYILSVHKDRTLIPASNQKLLISSSALLELGPDFTFFTGIYMSGTIKNGELDGYICLKGGGDPNLSGRFNSEDIYAPVRKWVDAVREAGIRNINGPVLIDDSMFDREFFHPSWPEKQAHKWYAAECGALSLNDNCIDLTIRPGKRGEPALWSFVPYTGYITVKNKCRTVRGKSARRIIISRRGTEITIGGSIGERSKGFFTHVPVHDPGLFTGAVFGRLLAKNGIQAEYIARVGKPLNYDRLIKICGIETQPLSETIRVMNARSQNMYAEMLLKYLGYRKKGKGTFANGREAIKDILKKHGFDMKGILLDDGSGLSRKNRVSADALVRILRLMYESEYRKTFLRSLAVPGDQYGTLRKYLRGEKLQGVIYGKSGYISRVKALSGYAVRDDGNVLVFSFLVNNYNPKSGWNINRLKSTLMKTLVNAAY